MSVARLTAVSAHHRAFAVTAASPFPVGQHQPAPKRNLYAVPVWRTCMAFLYAVHVVIADDDLYDV
jgi:hypothetical protein